MMKAGWVERVTDPRTVAIHLANSPMQGGTGYRNGSGACRSCATGDFDQLTDEQVQTLGEGAARIA